MAGFGYMGDALGAAEVLFSHPGDPGSAMSKPYLLRSARQVRGGFIATESPAPALQVLTIYLDDVVVDTISMLTGASYVIDSIVTSPGYAGTKLTVAFTSGGTGLDGVTVGIDLD